MKEINDLKLLLHTFIKGETCEIVKPSKLFLDIIRRNFLEGVFYVSCPDSSLRKLFKNKHRDYFIQYIGMVAEIKRLKKTRLKFELLKGANMLSFYKPGTRQFQDLDILMVQSEIIDLYKNTSFKYLGEDFYKDLGEIFFTSFLYELPFLDLKTGFVLDVHLSLYHGTTIFKPVLRHHFKNHKQEVTFLNFAIHSTANHCMKRIAKNLLDAAFLIPNIDWSVLVKISKETNSTSFLFIFLKFLEYLDFHIPEYVFRKLMKHSKVHQKIVFFLINLINKRGVLLGKRSIIMLFIYKAYYVVGPLYKMMILLHKIFSFLFKK